MLASIAYSLFLGLFITLFVLVSLLLILIVLIQKGRGGGLASAFGGGGGNTAFGSKTGDVLTWATSIIFGVFLLLAVILNLMTRQTPKSTVASPPPALPSQSQPLAGGAPTHTTPPAPTHTPAPGALPAPAPAPVPTAAPTTRPSAGK
jgi:preprotein translocase subunit SecG